MLKARFVFICILMIGLSACVKSINTAPSDMIQLFVPTAFTPNGDGINDTFLVVSKPDLILYHIRIYDNDNILLYDANDIKKGWDGKVNAQPVASGNYHWIIDYQAPGTKIYTRSGSVELVR